MHYYHGDRSWVECVDAVMHYDDDDDDDDEED